MFRQFLCHAQRAGRHGCLHGAGRERTGAGARDYRPGSGADHVLLRASLSPEGSVSCHHKNSFLQLLQQSAGGGGHGTVYGRHQKFFLYQSQCLSADGWGRSVREDRLYLRGRVLLCGSCPKRGAHLRRGASGLRLAEQQRYKWRGLQDAVSYAKNYYHYRSLETLPVTFQQVEITQAANDAFSLKEQTSAHRGRIFPWIAGGGLGADRCDASVSEKRRRAPRDRTVIGEASIMIGKNPYAVREIVLEGKVPARSLPWYLCAVLKKWLI